MKVDGTHYRSIWREGDSMTVAVIDQTVLPHEFRTRRLQHLDDAVSAIRDMVVRGAPLIGATAAYGLCLALDRERSDAAIAAASEALFQARPTAVNLAWALAEMSAALLPLPEAERLDAAWARADAIAEDDVETCAAIGRHGQDFIAEAWRAKGESGRVEILTHCNAGWLATVDWGTALAPIYRAHDAGIPVHVWVDETRPRNQGASLTTWELKSHGVPHTLVVDNAGGHLMQAGHVDLCITGTDRTAANGDVCNKIGTYLKALAAHDNQVPFYVALPYSTIDWDLATGVGTVPIEERAAEEVTHFTGRDASGELVRVALAPEETPAANHAFDVTPARLVTALITERGTCPASTAGLADLYPERRGRT